MEIPMFRVWHQIKDTFDANTKQWTFVWRMSIVQILNITAREVTIESKYGFGNRLYKIGKDCILMQSAGKKDSTGKPVFAGDIVLIRKKATGEEILAVVEDHQTAKILKAKDEILSDWDLYDLEVIGNIYEHPEKI